MLTKDLLKFRVRQNSIQPVFVDVADKPLLELGKAMIETIKGSVGQRVFEVEERLAEDGSDLDPLFPAFKKLLFDRTELAPVDTSVPQQRWQWILEAQRLRQEKYFAYRQAFQEGFSTQTAAPFADITTKLYEDLPEYQRVESFAELSPEDLIHRYNCAQVQGLLLRARSFELELPEASLKEKRELFRALKFHRLLAEVVGKVASPASASLSDGTPFRIKVTGPLSVFTQAQTYGAKFANFFPRVLHLSSWSLRANVLLSERKKDLTLHLTSDDHPLRSPYAAPRSYIPEDFQLLIQGFNEVAGQQWQAKPGDEFIHLGRQSYCFPDLAFVEEDGEKIYLELFHKWHWGQLEHRLSILEKNQVRHVKIGVCKSIAKKEQLKKIVEESPWFSQNGIIFSDFPTPKALLTLLSRNTSV